MVQCPICAKPVAERDINAHIDSGCKDHITEANGLSAPTSTQKPKDFSSFFSSQAVKRTAGSQSDSDAPTADHPQSTPAKRRRPEDVEPTQASTATRKRSLDQDGDDGLADSAPAPIPKRVKYDALAKVAPLAERMRPRTLDEVCGQELVGHNGVIRGLIESDKVPSMILWGGSGTGKTTIARLIAHTAGCRFIEINSTSTGVGEVKKLFGEARSEISLTGRKTILFCDEIHRFSKSQQDVFLGPVESGQIILIGATTENPSFKVINALLSRCRVFVLAKLTEDDIKVILTRALSTEGYVSSPLLDEEMITYLGAFADGDARTALNLLELAMDLSKRPNITKDEMKKSLTKTLVYDRAGDQHYDTISALHKSVRGSDPDAALYYLARMLQSGEDPLFIARRLVVMASEDIGLADNTMLPLAMAAYTAAEKVGMPECRINLAHATVALALAPKSTRSYRGLANASAALREPGVAGLPIPYHIRNAPTRLMKEMGYGKEYKYNPNYINGKVVQEYLPDKLQGRKFLEDIDLGTEIDDDLNPHQNGGKGMRERSPSEHSEIII